MINTFAFRHPRLKWHATVFGVFAVLAIVFSWPLAMYPNSCAAGDGYYNAHSFWWFRKALMSLRNPFFSDYFFYPEGASLLFHGTPFSNFIITLPVAILAGVNQSVNAAVILGYILSGYFTFLLAYELTQSRTAALIAGVIFAFNPLHYSTATAHLHVSTMQWIPLILLLYKKTLERKQLKWPLFAGLAMATIILTDQFQTILVALVLLVSLPFVFLNCRKVDKGFRFDADSSLRRVVFLLAIFAATATVSSLGYTAQAFRYLFSNHGAFAIGIFDHGGANSMSADLLGFITPPTYNPIWGNSFPHIAPRWRNSHFMGYVPLLLSFYGVWTFRKEGIVRFIAGISMTSWILSLGTTLHINDAWLWEGSFFKLPYYYLSSLPVFSDIRTPFRFHILTLCGLALLAAYGYTRLAIQFKMTATKKKIVTGLTCAVLFLEFMPSFQKPITTPVPKIYYQMAQDQEDYTVLELPLSRWTSLQYYGSGSPAIIVYYQTIHGKRIFNGAVSRASLDELIFKDNVLNEILDLTRHDNHVIVGQKKIARIDAEMDQWYRNYGKMLAKDTADMFKKYNVRYIVLHNNIADGTITRAFIEGTTGRKLTYVPEDSISYIKLY